MLRFPKQPREEVLAHRCLRTFLLLKEAECVDHDANLHKAIRLTSQIAMVVAAFDRIRKANLWSSPAARRFSLPATSFFCLNGENRPHRGKRPLMLPDPARRP